MTLSRLARVGVAAIVIAACGTSTREVATVQSDRVSTESTAVAAADSLQCWISGQVLTRGGIAIRDHNDVEAELGAIIKELDGATRRSIEPRDPVLVMRVSLVEFVDNLRLDDALLASWKIGLSDDYNRSQSSATNGMPDPSVFEVVVGIYDIESSEVWVFIGEDGGSRKTYEECVAAPRSVK